MISSKNKINKDLFKVLMSKGRSISSPSFNARVFFDKTVVSGKFSVVVAKKLEKSAVRRNKMKRRLYSAIRSTKVHAKNGMVCALFVKKKIFTKDVKGLQVELERFFKGVI